MCIRDRDITVDSVESATTSNGMIYLFGISVEDSSRTLEQVQVRDNPFIFFNYSGDFDYNDFTLENITGISQIHALSYNGVELTPAQIATLTFNDTDNNVSGLEQYYNDTEDGFGPLPTNALLDSLVVDVVREGPILTMDDSDGRAVKFVFLQPIPPKNSITPLEMATGTDLPEANQVLTYVNDSEFAWSDQTGGTG